MYVLIIFLQTKTNGMNFKFIFNIDLYLSFFFYDLKNMILKVLFKIEILVVNIR